MSGRPRPGRSSRYQRHGAGGGGGGGHGGGDARWLVTYADLLTLLMVLFLVLWVISTIDLKKFEEFKQGLGAFGNPAAGATVASPGGAAPPMTGELAGPGTPDPAAALVAVTTTVPTATPTELGGADGSPASGPPVLDAGGLAAAVLDVEAAIAAAGLPDIVEVISEERGLVVRIASDDVLYDSGSATVTAAGAGILAVVAPSLLGFANQIVVEGHTDHRPLRRDGYDNWDLSVDRAVSVIKLLRDDFALPPERLSAAGYGDQRPLASGDDATALARNRRVEIVVLAGPPQ
jgi:chemotaxis protein MotB